MGGRGGGIRNGGKEGGVHGLRAGGRLSGGGVVSILQGGWKALNMLLCYVQRIIGFSVNRTFILSEVYCIICKKLMGVKL